MQMSHLATDGASKIAYSLEPILNLAHLRQLLSNQAIDDASKLHVKHKMLLDSYFLEKGAKPFIGKTSEKLDHAENIHTALKTCDIHWMLKTFTPTGADSANISIYHIPPRLWKSLPC